MSIFGVSHTELSFKTQCERRRTHSVYTRRSVVVGGVKKLIHWALADQLTSTVFPMPAEHSWLRL